MLRTLSVHNYKSLHHFEIELGRFNVFIGENGAGKSNVLEALAFASAVLERRTSVEDLYNRGVRVAPPSLTRGAFKGSKGVDVIPIEIGFEGEENEYHKVKMRISQTSQSATNVLWEDLTFAGHWADSKSAELEERVSDILAKVGERLRLLKGELGRLKADSGTKLDDYDGLKSIFADLDTAFGNAGLLLLLTDFSLYTPNALALRGLEVVSRKEPIGLHGENLDVAFASLPKKLRESIIERTRCISWLDNIVVDADDSRRLSGSKPGRSRSKLYFRDRFMRLKNNTFSAESTNEGVLFLLFYLTLFACPDTPAILAVDNIETSLNPQLCRELTKHLAQLAVEHNKQALITTHNPAVLDGLNLHDDEQRLFVVSRDDAGHTVARRLKVKPDTDPALKLSELWMRGHLGGLTGKF